MIGEIIVLLISVIAGFIIVKYTQDELESGKKWFLVLFICSLFMGLFYIAYHKMSWATILFSLAIISGISYFKARKA